MSPVFSATWMNSLAGSDAAVGLAPAQQRFELRRLEGVQRHLRLIHEQQLTALDRAAQRLLEAEALRGGVVQRGTVERVAVAAELLGAKQRHVGGAQQALGVRGMVGVEAGADAGAGGEHATVDDERLLQRGDDLGGVALDFARSSSTSSSSTVNSSPPRRASSPLAPLAACRRCAMCCSTRSPKLWPRVSLIDLKLSTSTNSSASRCPGPARASALSRWAESLRRLGSCVSGS